MSFFNHNLIKIYGIRAPRREITPRFHQEGHGNYSLYKSMNCPRDCARQEMCCFGGQESITWKTFAVGARCLAPELSVDAAGRLNADFRGYSMHWMLWKKFHKSKTGDRHARILSDQAQTCDAADVFGFAKFKQATKRVDKIHGLRGVMERLGVQIPNTQQLSNQARAITNQGIRSGHDPAPTMKDTDPTFEKQIFCVVTFAIMKQTKFS
jgi:hypothetical protein